MAMGQQKDRQGDLMVSWSEMPRSPGHVFYDRLQLVLIEGGFDGFAEAVKPYYAARMGALRCHPSATSVCTWRATSRVSTPRGRSGAARIPCRYGSSCCWRCGNGCRTIPAVTDPRACPMKSTRRCLTGPGADPEAGLVTSASGWMPRPWRPTRRCATSCGGTRARVTGGCWSAAQESGIETPTAEDLARRTASARARSSRGLGFHRQDRTAPRTWPTSPSTRCLDTGAVVAASCTRPTRAIRPLPKTLAAAEANLEAVDVAPTAEDPAECVTDKGYLTVGLEGARRRPLEEPDLRAQAEGFCALARR